MSYLSSAHGDIFAVYLHQTLNFEENLLLAAKRVQFPNLSSVLGLFRWAEANTHLQLKSPTSGISSFFSHCNFFLHLFAIDAASFCSTMNLSSFDICQLSETI